LRETSCLNGIISYLTNEFGGNVIDRNIVSITASSLGNVQSYPLRSVVDFENQSMFRTNSLENAWICYDFKDMVITLDHYSIRTRCDTNGSHLRSWRLEGSSDGSKWLKIDEKMNDESLNSRGAVASFPISAEFIRAFRMVRLRQTGKNSTGVSSLVLSLIEFFGELKESSNKH
jgi:hypothetical protein